jgi:hypothetical protein
MQIDKETGYVIEKYQRISHVVTKIGVSWNAIKAVLDADGGSSKSEYKGYTW